MDFWTTVYIVFHQPQRHRRRHHGARGHVPPPTFTNSRARGHRAPKNSKQEIAKYFLSWWAKTSIGLYLHVSATGINTDNTKQLGSGPPLSAITQSLKTSPSRCQCLWLWEFSLPYYSVSISVLRLSLSSVCLSLTLCIVAKWCVLAWAAQRFWRWGGVQVQIYLTPHFWLPGGIKQDYTVFMTTCTKPPKDFGL